MDKKLKMVFGPAKHDFSFQQAEHDFLNDPFIDDRAKQFIRQIREYRPEVLEAIYINLWEQKVRNRVPLCSSCTTKGHSFNESEAPSTDEVGAPDEPVSTPAVYVCLTCLVPTTLCSACLIKHDRDHNVFSIADVFSNMFTAAAGFRVAPLTPVSILAYSSNDELDTKSEEERSSSSSSDRNTDPNDTVSDSDDEVNEDLNTHASDNNALCKTKSELQATHTCLDPPGSLDFIKPVLMNPSPDDLDDLNWPYGLCSSPMGHVIIADTYNHRVLITEAGKTIYKLGPSDEEGKDNFSYPIGVTCFQRPHSIREPINIAIADSGNSKIRIFNSEGTQTQEIIHRLKRPHGVCACSEYGDVIVSDIANRSLIKFTFDGRVLQLFSDPNQGSTVTHLKQPSYIECSGDHDQNMIFVSDTLGRCVKVFDNVSGKLITTYGSFQSPHGLCYDAYQRTLMVADYMRSSVDVVDLRKGCVIGTIANVNNGLIGPTDLAFHTHTRQVLVMDTTRGKLRQFPIPPLPASVATNFLD